MRALRLVAVSVLAAAVCLATAEVGRRILDGYYVWRVDLVKNPGSTDLTWSDERPAEALMRTIPLDIEADRSWFYDRPRPRQATPPEWAEKRRAAGQAQANYVWNAARLSDPQLQEYLQTYKGLDEIFVFRAPGANPYPFYRLYPEIQTGFAFTNRYGWMSGPIAETKPANVVRIGVLGDSTTRDYPVLVEHWLNLWAVRRNLGVRFEILNAARPASGAFDAAAIFDLEFGPADPDYVILYGFGNGIHLADDLIKLPPGIVRGRPASWAASKAGLIDRVSSRAGTSLEPLARRSAAAGFLRDRLLGHYGGKLLAEPSKPATQIVFPPGIDERSPDPDRIAGNTSQGLMLLDTYLQGLNKIDAMAKARNVGLFVSTFRIIAFDGMRANEYIFKNVNEQAWWPYSYAQIRRLLAFYNRTLRAWARARGQSVIDVDEQMPWRPELYADGMHEMPTGEALHAWIVLQELMPRIRDDLARRQIPRPARQPAQNVGQYWTIERAKVAGVIGTHVSARLPLAPLAPADEISGAFPLSKTRFVHPKSEVVPGAVPLIKTAPEPSGYAAAITFEAPGPAPAGRGWVGARLKVNEGGVTVGVLDKSMQRFLAYVNLEQAPDIQEIQLVIPDLSDLGMFIVANNRPGQMASSIVELHGVVLNRFR